MVCNFQECVQRIVANTKEAPQENFLVLLVHNGPTGLGSKVKDICGRDWVQRGGDHGDADFEEAIALVKQDGIKVPLVVFGHMHETLQLGNPVKRTMFVVGQDNTMYLDAAVVPRVMPQHRRGLKSTQHHFVVVDVTSDRKEVERVAEAWVTVEGEEFQVKESVMFSRARL